MQQQIGFCSTADGARIAYATVGAGPALVVASQSPSHLGLEWEEPHAGDFWEAIGRHHQVVRYDKHGCGLSDRNRTDFSLDFEVRTIDAIVKNLGLKSPVLWGWAGQGAAAAISYAVKFPDRVSHLILCNAQARWHGSFGSSEEEVRALVCSNRRMGALALAECMLGSAFLDPSALQWYLRFREEGVASPEILDQLLSAQLWNVDLRNLLPEVRVPTLVVHYRNNRMIPFEAGRELAAGIGGARFVPLEGDAHLFFFGDTLPLRRAIAEFLGDPIDEGGQPRTDAAKSSLLPRQRKASSAGRASSGPLPVGVRCSD
jgi:pimeloyl-ACP methyl ester carboxylesterase